MMIDRLLQNLSSDVCLSFEHLERNAKLLQYKIWYGTNGDWEHGPTHSLTITCLWSLVINGMLWWMALTYLEPLLNASNFLSQTNFQQIWALVNISPWKLNFNYTLQDQGGVSSSKKFPKPTWPSVYRKYNYSVQNYINFTFLRASYAFDKGLYGYLCAETNLVQVLCMGRMLFLGGAVLPYSSYNNIFSMYSRATIS